MKIAILSGKKNTYFNKKFCDGITDLYGSNIRTEIINPMDCVVVMDDNNPKLYVKGKELNKIDIVIPRIDADCLDYGVCIIKYFEKLGIPVINGSQVFVKCRNKFEMLQNLSMLKNIKIPKTLLVKDNRGLDQVIDLIGGLPAIIKTTRLGKNNLGAVLISKSDYADAFLDLEFLFSGFIRCDQNIIVQEFIRGAIGRSFNYLVMGNKITNAFVSKRTLANNITFDALRNNIRSQIEITEEVREFVLNIADDFGLEFGMISMIDVNQGRFVFKVNPLINIEEIENNYDVDIMSKFLRYVLYEVKTSVMLGS